MAHLASLGGIAPEVAVCLATGNTARVHRLETGTIAVGREADIALVDAPQGSAADSALGALAHRRPAGRRDDPHRRQAGHRPQPQHAARRTRSGGRQGPGHRRRRALGAGMGDGGRCTSACGCRASRSGDQTASLAEMGALPAARRGPRLRHRDAHRPPARRAARLSDDLARADHAARGAVGRHPHDPARHARPRAPVPRAGPVREAVGDARPAVGRAVDPRRRRRLDGGRVRGGRASRIASAAPG